MSVSSAPDLVRISLFTMLPLCRKRGLDAMLDGLETDGDFQPTHWGPDERARQLYDRNEMIETVATYEGGYFKPGIARRKKVKYIGYFDAAAGSIQSLQLKFEADLGTKLRKVFELGSNLSRRLKPLFGFVHPVWLGQGQEYNVAGRLDGGEFQQFGPRSICARTWLGPALVELVGREVLDTCGAAIRDTAWGGVEVELLPEPWNHGIQSLAKARVKVMRAIASAGVFGDFRVSRKYQPGPKWDVERL